MENILGDYEFEGNVRDVFKKIIRNNQEVSNKVLFLFLDDLYLSEDKDLRINSFEILGISANNYDVSDEIFDKIELERAGLAIESEQEDKNEAITYLK